MFSPRRTLARDESLDAYHSSTHPPSGVTDDHSSGRWPLLAFLSLGFGNPSLQARIHKGALSPGCFPPLWFTTPHLNNSFNKCISDFQFGVCHLFPAGSLTDHYGFMKHGAVLCPCHCLPPPTEKGSGTQGWAASHPWDNPGEVASPLPVSVFLYITKIV